MPVQLVQLEEEDSHKDLVLLTDRLRKKLDLQGPMKAVVILMVVRVTFADGTIYDAEPTFKALEAYCHKLAGIDDDQEVERQQ